VIRSITQSAHQDSLISGKFFLFDPTKHEPAMATKYRHYFVLPGLLVAGMAWALPACAETDADQFELSPEQLFEATVVSVSRTSEKLIEAPAAVYVLTNEDIIRSGATSIPEALRLVPGVQVAQVNANNWAVSVRGFGSGLANKLLVLMDGREVYDPLFSGVYWDIQDVILEDIERVEVIRGPGASLWGANAVNGVINIITKKAADTQGNLLSITGGTQPRGIVEERYGGKLGESGYYRVYGKYTNRDDEQSVTGGSAHDGQEAAHTGFRGDWKQSSLDSFTLQGDVYNSIDGNKTALPSLTLPFAQPAVDSYHAQGGNILGRWNHDMADNSHFTVQSFVEYKSRSQLILMDKHTLFDLDAQYELPEKGVHKIIVGGGYRNITDELTESPFVSFSNEGENTSVVSGFVQDKITLEPRTWFLTLGSKFEHNDFTGFEIQPNARLQWQPDETQTVWASVTRAVRTPSRLEHDLTVEEAVLSLGGIPAELLLRPDPDLHSEELIAYEIGYRNQLTSQLLVDMAAFYNDYQALATSRFLTPTLILTPPAHFVFPFTTTNDTHGETYGFEAVTDWRALDNLKFTASYTALAMHLSGPSGNVAINAGATQGQSPKQQFNIASRWDVMHNVSFDTTLYNVTAIPGFQLPEHWELGARLSWKILEGLQFSLVGQNLLENEHREFSLPTDTATANIGRSVYGNFTWRY
jgi:iron complex outermembrane receptor protein